MDGWCQRMPQRFATEVSLWRAGTNAELCWRGGRLCADEEIRIGRLTFGFRTTYPELFPNRAPVVTLQYPSLPPSVAIHLLSGSQLCLLGVDEWSPRLTGLALRDRAVLWAHALCAFLATGVFQQPTPPRVRR